MDVESGEKVRLNSTALRKSRGLCWWGHVATGTTENMKLDPGSSVEVIDP